MGFVIARDARRKQVDKKQLFSWIAAASLTTVIALTGLLFLVTSMRFGEGYSQPAKVAIYALAGCLSVAGAVLILATKAEEIFKDGESWSELRGRLLRKAAIRLRRLGPISLPSNIFARKYWYPWLAGCLFLFVAYGSGLEASGDLEDTQFAAIMYPWLGATWLIWLAIPFTATWVSGCLLLGITMSTSLNRAASWLGGGTLAGLFWALFYLLGRAAQDRPILPSGAAYVPAAAIDTLAASMTWWTLLFAAIGCIAQTMLAVLKGVNALASAIVPPVIAWLSCGWIDRALSPVSLAQWIATDYGNSLKDMAPVASGEVITEASQVIAQQIASFDMRVVFLWAVPVTGAVALSIRVRSAWDEDSE